MMFEQLNLDPAILKALDACGYKNPTPIQERCIPEILNGKDLVGCAQTGTGKTASFVLPALNLLSQNQKSGPKPKVLILSPTRELASQITQAVIKYSKFLRFIKIANLVGGMSYRDQIRDLRSADIIVATPGRLMDHMENGRVDLSEIAMFILDEADRMLDMGFIDDVQNIAQELPAERQTLLFSATVDNRLSKIIQNLLKNPLRVDLSQKSIVGEQIKQTAYLTDNIGHKMRLLQHFLSTESIFKAIIFCATKASADNLADELGELGFSAAAFHGDLKQNTRNRIIQQLHRGRIQFLVATDVAARGIDVADVSHVVNFDMPRFCEDYVHRIGRTGRIGKTGIAISFVLPLELRHLQRIERFTNQKLFQDVVPGLEPTKRKSAPPRSERFGRTERPGRAGGFAGRADRPERAGGFAGRGERSERAGGFAGRADRPERAGGFAGRGDRPERAGGFAGRGERSERAERFGRPDRAERPERAPGFAGRGDRPERAGGFAGRGERAERFGRPDRAERPEYSKKRKFAGASNSPKAAYSGEKKKEFGRPRRESRKKEFAAG